ncbi:hypothetical protein KP509_34G005900 [Ceratopteris richardii]|uniref:Jacalin-type lectin domain-containing protein n=1 Tax=Ceratopteris richardii TaxID=49495 RepID=A0A8T2QH02_CERRI|nr:hypothetical protein KP509_1Z159200 [Ceratopteris richardii]KAH7283407.1 hypothetical protein KP509_34G005900 [Ceratopteris richardii]
MAQATCKRVSSHPAPPTASSVAEDLLSHQYCSRRSNAEVTAPLCFIGGRGGSQHVVKGWQEGKLITKLRVYSGPWQIKAVRLWLSGDGDSEYKQFGEPGGSAWAEFAFQDGEVVTAMSLWGNGAGTRAGWIHFRTNKGRSFDYGMHDWPKKTEYPVNVGSGILVGAIYNAGADIDAHGYYFLDSPIARARATDVCYPNLTFDSHQITPITLDSYSQRNTSPHPISWGFSGNQVAKQSQKWTSQIGNSFSVSLTVEAAVSI